MRFVIINNLITVSVVLAIPHTRFQFTYNFFLLLLYYLGSLHKAHPIEATTIQQLTSSNKNFKYQLEVVKIKKKRSKMCEKRNFFSLTRSFLCRVLYILTYSIRSDIP